MDYENEQEFYSKLIEAVRKNRCLFDKRDFNYFNRHKRTQAWDSVSQLCDRPMEECQTRWKQLRERFLRELRKMQAGSLLDGDEWSLFRDLSFLTEFATRRKRRRSEMEQPTDELQILPINGEEEEFRQSQHTQNFRQISISYKGTKEKLERALTSIKDTKNLESKDSVFARSILALMRQLPIDLKDEFKSLMYSEVFRLRAETRERGTSIKYN